MIGASPNAWRAALGAISTRTGEPPRASVPDMMRAWLKIRELNILSVLIPVGIAGIDIGAKAEVRVLLARLASQEIGIILISSDLLKVLAVSDRVLVVREGRLNGELTRAGAIQERVMAAATA